MINKPRFKITRQSAVVEALSQHLMFSSDHIGEALEVDFHGLCREFPDRKLQLIKIVRELTGAGLRASKIFVEALLEDLEKYPSATVPHDLIEGSWDADEDDTPF